MTERVRRMGWWAIPGEELLAKLLRRVAQGESPDVVYIEEWANCTRENLAKNEDD